MGDESNRVAGVPETDARSIDPGDLAPVVLSKVELVDFTLVADPPLALEVRLDDEEPRTLELDIVELGIFVSGRTREALMDELHAHLELAWAEYAEAVDSELSGDARDIKRALLSRFHRIPRSHESE